MDAIEVQILEAHMKSCVLTVREHESEKEHAIAWLYLDLLCLQHIGSSKESNTKLVSINRQGVSIQWFDAGLSFGKTQDVH